MATATIGYVGLDHSHRDGYLESLAALPAEVTCVCEPNADIDPASIDALGDVPFYRDPETLFAEEDIDAAWVTLPNRDAPSAVRAAIDSGVDVFSEKPMARSAGELEPVAERATDGDVTVAVAYAWRSHPASRDLRSFVDDGVLGTVEAVNAKWMASRLETRLASGPGRHIYDRAASRGGILQWLGCHWLDLIGWLLRDPIERIHANLTRSHPATEIDDSATVEFETRGGAVGALQCGYRLRDGYDTEISVYGTAGASRSHRRGFGAPDDCSRLRLDSSSDGWNTAPRRTFSYDEPDAPGYFGRIGAEFMRQFLEARSGDAAVPAGIDDALEVLYVLDAIYESAETRAWETVDR